MTALEQHSFAGNIRELRNIIQAALVECDSTELTVDHLRCSRLTRPASPAHANATTPAATAARPEASLNLADLEQVAIREAIRRAEGNMSKAALLLGINRPKLYRKVAQADLSPPR